MRTQQPRVTRTLAPFRALLRHELRLLAQNRVACVIVVAILATAGMTRFDETANHDPRDTCYIVYWQEDPWVRRLQQAAQQVESSEGPRIRVVSVDDQIDGSGMIRYPPGSHSIQLRPDAPGPNGQQRFLIWYWHDGNDSSVLWPYARWFWRVTREHFGQSMDWTERVSSLRPELVVPGMDAVRVPVDSLFEGARAEVVLVWLLLFFVAGHLATLSMAEMRLSGTLPSMALTCAGWKGVARAKRLFYAALAIALAAAAAAMIRPQALQSPAFWLAVVGGTVVYLGIAFVIGCRSKTVASASVGTMGYLLASGAVFWLAGDLLVIGDLPVRNWVIAEAPLLLTMRSALGPDSQISTLAGATALFSWALFWHVAGELSYRQLRA